MGLVKLSHLTPTKESQMWTFTILKAATANTSTMSASTSSSIRVMLLSRRHPLLLATARKMTMLGSMGRSVGLVSGIHRRFRQGVIPGIAKFSRGNRSSDLATKVFRKTKLID